MINSTHFQADDLFELVQSSRFLTLPKISQPKYIVFSDFDESYFPHHLTYERKQNVRSLENFIAEKSEEAGLIFGLVTGSSVEWVFQKMAVGEFKYLPHFIASDLGTQIHHFSQSEKGKMDEEWVKFFNTGEYRFEKIKEINSFLSQKGIFLERQPQLGSPKYKYSFYYYSQGDFEDKKNLQCIKEAADASKIAVSITRCNPLAGDPENSYDVDFIPVGTGKDEIVEFLLSKFNVEWENSFAFGDSENDLKMLQAVKNGFLLENARPEAKRKFKRIANGAYSEGILQALKEEGV